MIKGGYVGKILRVDLSKAKLTDEALPDEKELRKYIGGAGLAMKFMYDEIPPRVGPDDPENKVFFMSGPLSGTIAPSSSRHCVMTVNGSIPKSVGAGWSGGNWCAYLKQAGYDGVIVEGESKEPVYIWIHEGKAELREAGHLWGKKTEETLHSVEHELGMPDISITGIGPAGEAGIKGASVCTDENHLSAKSGAGGALGRKKLKAIAVGGTKLGVQIADPKRAVMLAYKWRDAFRKCNAYNRRNGGNPRRAQALAKDGKLMVYNLSDVSKQITYANGLVEMLNSSIQIPKPCINCPIGCAYDVKIGIGPYQGEWVTIAGGMENLEGSGGNIGCTDGGTIMYLTHYQDQMGIDAAWAGQNIALAYECYNRGLLKKEHTDGLELTWGNKDAALELIDKMIRGEGFGKLLCNELKRFSEILSELCGSDVTKFATHMKGTAVGAHDLRCSWEYLLGNAIAGAGPILQGVGVDSWSPEPDFGYPERPKPYDKKRAAPMVAKTQHKKQFEDSLCLCWFMTWGVPGITTYAPQMLKYVVGWDFNGYEEAEQIGQRITTLQRVFNLRRGLTAADDMDIGARLLEDPGAGIAKGHSWAPHAKKMIKEYYGVMGWEEDTGKPLPETLERLDLGHLIKDIWD
jgi:aldehyde:ferredoxin oxidoreductase